METLFIVLLGVGMGLLIVVGIAFSRAAAKKTAERRAALGALATELGLTFEPSSDTSMSAAYAHFDKFTEGEKRTAYNTLQGTISIEEMSVPIRIGDYRYTVTHTSGSGSNRTTRSTTYRLTYIIMRLPFTDVPDTLIRRENIFDKIGGAIGFDDIDFESDEFSRKFFVKGKNRQFTYGLIHQGMMEFFLNEPFSPIEIISGDCLIHDGDSTWSVAEIKKRLDFARGFIRRWPSGLLDDVYNRT